MTSHHTTNMDVFGSILCTTVGAKDPAQGFYKQCWCEEESSDPYICATNPRKNCACNGKVYYGRKYVGGKPGKGAITTFEQMTSHHTTNMDVFGSILCTTVG